MIPRLVALCLGALLVTACQRNDLKDPPVDLGDFALGLNIVVADHVRKVPISREASVEEWEAVMKKAVDDRFGRYEGTKLYNLGISVDGYALAPPGIPVVAAPKSVVAVTANIWDDAAGKKLNAAGEKMTVFESLNGASIVGSGYTMSKEEQMEALAYNTAKRVEGWLLEHPEWFGLPPLPPKAAPMGGKDK
ncbi:hypothetical protein [Rhodobacter sp. NSM]|uniref:hypothetical protein n=1 Tax=Rhodobacter sp. NSM TaxID=3457501 RepID=UPI003FCF1FA5